MVYVVVMDELGRLRRPSIVPRPGSSFLCCMGAVPYRSGRGGVTSSNKIH